MELLKSQIKESAEMRERALRLGKNSNPLKVAETHAELDQIHGLAQSQFHSDLLTELSANIQIGKAYLSGKGSFIGLKRPVRSQDDLEERQRLAEHARRSLAAQAQKLAPKEAQSFLRGNRYAWYEAEFALYIARRANEVRRSQSKPSTSAPSGARSVPESPAPPVDAAF